jgi:hypothetical protein
VNPADVFKIEIKISVDTTLPSRRRRISDSGFPHAMCSLHNIPRVPDF